VLTPASAWGQASEQASPARLVLVQGGRAGLDRRRARSRSECGSGGVSSLRPRHRDTSPGGSYETPGAGAAAIGARMQAKCPQGVRLADASQAPGCCLAWNLVAPLAIGVKLARASRSRVGGSVVLVDCASERAARRGCRSAPAAVAHRAARPGFMTPGWGECLAGAHWRGPAAGRLRSGIGAHRRTVARSASLLRGRRRSPVPPRWPIG
jgi:hypothetical protein